MSAITLAQAQAMVDALMASQGATGPVMISIHGRTVTYSTPAEFQASLNYWIRMVNLLSRRRDGMPRQGYSVVDFRGCR